MEHEVSVNGGIACLELPGDSWYAACMGSHADKDFAQIRQLMPLVSMQDLQGFLEHYAREHGDFRTSWVSWLCKHCLPEGTGEESVRACVSAVFGFTSLVGSRRWDDDCLNWVELGESMFRLLQSLPEFPLETRPATAIEFLRRLGAYGDDEALADEEWCEVSEAVDLAQGYIAGYVERDDVSATDKQAVVEEFERVASLPFYDDYCMFGLGRLLFDLRLALLDGEGAMRMLDAEISRGSNLSKVELIRRKCALLRKMQRGDEVEPLLREYLHLDDIRRDLVELLMQDGRYEDGMKLMDEVVRRRSGNDILRTNNWRELQYSYAEKNKDSARQVSLCKELFIATSGRPEYYRKLKKLIPGAQWHDCLSGLVERVKSRRFYCSENLAGVFLAENQPERLLEVLPDNYWERLRFICRYAPQMKDASSLLGLFPEAAREHADKNVSRGSYRELAGYMEKIQALPGGRECVSNLVEEFRVRYRRRTAMMDEIKHL